MIRRVLRSLADRNWSAEWLLRRRCGRGGMFLCRGRMQLRLARGAVVAAPARPCCLGVPLLGNATAWDARTVVSVASGGCLELDGAAVGRGVCLSVGKGARLRIGRGSYVTDGTRVAAQCLIEIGSGCAISWGVSILDDDGHGFGPPPYSAPVRIGDHVWVGCNVTILKGVTIGAGSVVAAGAVVTRSCPPASLLAGVPARVVRAGVHWTDAQHPGPGHARSA